MQDYQPVKRSKTGNNLIGIWQWCLLLSVEDWHVILILKAGRQKGELHHVGVDVIPF